MIIIITVIINITSIIFIRILIIYILEEYNNTCNIIYYIIILFPHIKTHINDLYRSNIRLLLLVIGLSNINSFLIFYKFPYSITPHYDHFICLLIISMYHNFRITYNPSRHSNKIPK